MIEELSPNLSIIIQNDYHLVKIIHIGATVHLTKLILRRFDPLEYWSLYLDTNHYF